MRAHSLMEARKRKRRFKRCSLETRQALMTTWMQGRKERTGSGDIRMHSWAGGREERALQSPGVHCSPHSVHLPQPHSSPRVGAACLCLFRLGRIIYLGKEQSGASSKPEVQKGLQYPDLVTSSWRTA